MDQRVADVIGDQQNADHITGRLEDLPVFLLSRQVLAHGDQQGHRGHGVGHWQHHSHARPYQLEKFNHLQHASTFTLSTHLKKTP